MKNKAYTQPSIELSEFSKIDIILVSDGSSADFDVSDLLDVGGNG